MNQSYEGAATYDAEVDDNGILTSLLGPDEAEIRSIGRVSGAGSSEAARHTIVARIRREQDSTDANTVEAPPFMQYAMISEASLDLDGNVNVDINVEGDEVATYNANVHTNGTLTVNGASARVRGFGSYVTGENVKDQHENKIFNPYDNSSNEPVVKKVDPVDLPADSFWTAAQDVANSSADRTEDASGGTFDLAGGDYDFRTGGDEGTADNPYVFHVKNGNLKIAGDVTMQGYVVFVVEGDINVEGSVQMGGLERGESHMGFYAKNDINIHGNVDVFYGQAFARDDFDFGGNPEIRGTVAAGDEATIHGTPDIKYVPASGELANLQPEAETQYRLVSYNEF